MTINAMPCPAVQMKQYRQFYNRYKLNEDVVVDRLIYYMDAHRNDKNLISFFTKARYVNLDVALDLLEKKKPQCKLILIFISLRHAGRPPGHANVIIYETRIKMLFRYEPHGTTLTRDKLFWKMLGSGNRSFISFPNREIQGQNMFCSLWSLDFAHEMIKGVTVMGFAVHAIMHIYYSRMGGNHDCRLKTLIFDMTDRLMHHLDASYKKMKDDVRKLSRSDSSSANSSAKSSPNSPWYSSTNSSSASNGNTPPRPKPRKKRYTGIRRYLPQISTTSPTTQPLLPNDTSSLNSSVDSPVYSSANSSTNSVKVRFGSKRPYGPLQNRTSPSSRPLVNHSNSNSRRHLG